MNTLPQITGSFSYQNYATIENRIKNFQNYEILGVDASGQNLLYAIHLGNKEKPKFFIGASMHGTEWQTTQYTLNFFEKMKDGTFENMEFRNFMLENYHIIYVPVINPYGLNQASNNLNAQFNDDARYNFNGVDLNRDFYSFTQPESRLIRGLIYKYKPFASVDCHTFQSEYESANGNNIIWANGQKETVVYRDDIVSKMSEHTNQNITVWLNELSKQSGLLRGFVARQSNEYTENNLSYIFEMVRPTIVDGVLYEKLTHEQLNYYGQIGLMLFMLTSHDYYLSQSIQLKIKTPNGDNYVNYNGDKIESVVESKKDRKIKTLFNYENDEVVSFSREYV
jgi:hypothetical protein